MPGTSFFCRLHHGHARLGLDGLLGSVGLNVRDFGHGIGATCFSSVWEASGGRRPRALKAAGANGFIPATWRRLYRPIETETPGPSARDALTETLRCEGCRCSSFAVIAIGAARRQKSLRFRAFAERLFSLTEDGLLPILRVGLQRPFFGGGVTVSFLQPSPRGACLKRVEVTRICQQ